MFSNEWSKGGSYFPNWIPNEKERWKVANIEPKIETRNPINPFDGTPISDVDFEDLKQIFKNIPRNNFFESIISKLNRIEELEFPSLPPVYANLTANWGLMYLVWFFETTTSLDNGIWQGNNKCFFNEDSSYSIDISNSVSFNDESNTNCIKNKFFKKSDAERPNPFKQGFGFSGPDSGKPDYYSYVEWFLGSYDTRIYWEKLSDNSYQLDVTITNKSSWYSATRLPQTWQDYLLDETGVKLENLVDSASRGNTIKRKLNNKIVYGLESLGFIIPSFGGNWNQEYKFKKNWL